MCQIKFLYLYVTYIGNTALTYFTYNDHPFLGLDTPADQQQEDQYNAAHEEGE